MSSGGFLSEANAALAFGSSYASKDGVSKAAAGSAAANAEAAPSAVAALSKALRRVTVRGTDARSAEEPAQRLRSKAVVKVLRIFV